MIFKLRPNGRVEIGQRLELKAAIDEFVSEPTATLIPIYDSSEWGIKCSLGRLR
jgi:hypothetical protein